MDNECDMTRLTEKKVEPNDLKFGTSIKNKT